MRQYISTKPNILKKTLEMREMGAIIPLIVIFITTSIMNPNFLLKTNLSTIITLLAFYAILAAGESILIMAGEIDISIGQVSALCALVACVLMTKMNMNPVLALLFAVLLGAILGMANGLIVTYLKLSAFITTIGMYFIARGFKFILTKGYPVFPLPESVTRFGADKPLGISWSFFIAVALYLFFHLILSKTVYGRHIYTVGDNKEVAVISGINAKIIKISAYMICSMCAALAGFLVCAQVGVGQPTMGDGWELQAIAGAAVGGISLAGGSGSMLGTGVGILFIAVLNNALIILRVDSNVQTVLTGIVLIGAVTFDTIKNSRKIRA